MKINIPAYVREVMDILRKNGFEAYIVGGCVRDSLLGKTPYDFDICTDAKPYEMQKLFAGYNTVETGLKHGTLTVISHHKPVEVTTYRSDGEYKDHRRPEQVVFQTSLEEDLKRRDFTVNALCCSNNSDIIDMFGGRQDLNDKIIRCVGDPQKRFDEDALRIMRGLRFACVLGFEIEKNTAAAMKRQAKFLKEISAERIFTELTKLLRGEAPSEVLLDYRDIFGIIIPEFKAAFDFPQKCPHHCYDVYTHICKSVDNIQKDKVLRLTMLLHDIEKPKMAVTDENGVMHFKMHPTESSKTARVILRRLKCDKKTTEQVCDLIAEHDNRLENAKKTTVKKFIAKYGKEFFFNYIKVRMADTLAQSDYQREKKTENIRRLKKLGEQIINEEGCLKLSELAIGGRDMMDIGLKGRQIGEALKLAFNAVLEEKIPNEKDKLLSFIKENSINET